MSTTWFEQLFGFRELPYAETQSRFELEGTTLRSTVNDRSFEAGHFSTPSLAWLRERTRGLRPGRLKVRHEVIDDVLELHAMAENSGAMFQAASQFNCLEFAGADEVPEDGVTQYDDDPTQGPACALAAAAGTVVRNYFVEVGGARGQTRNRQLNNLSDLQAAVGEAGTFVEVRNGYTFSDAARLRRLNAALSRQDRDALLGTLRIGLHSRVGVTFARRFVEPTGAQYVSQAYCSALSCGYTGGGLELWAPLATLVLDAAYEATLHAAVLDAAEGHGSGKVWLTFLGGGAFGNDKRWIADAISRGLERFRDRDLDVRLAHHRHLDPAVVAAVDATRE
ncbi:MAG: hypothetical protein R3B13_19630 [Polyangiaceae bacterium]